MMQTSLNANSIVNKNISTISKTLHVDFYVYEQCETDGDLANGVVVLCLFGN